ncbi:neural cell adhesion molecule L1-like isoform X2 [Biomphalaria glabrata]|uniref:Neural cell adhesion molecule L1-like isoform X2 n=1 Tax=Biomphalaria glabrata TaxID=6526 RepID=A0A9W2Z9D3_BIOGL|nr:neural cell adhesion molecule L1-like isoform X2 [Biomphalaria glabrata]
MLQLMFLLLLSSFFFSSHCITDVLLSPPDITNPIEAVTLYKGELDFVVKCEATGIPKPTYQWKRNNQDIPPSSYITYDANTGDLTFKGFSEREEGEYRCYASNVLEQTTAVSVSQPVTIKKYRFLRPDSNLATEPVSIKQYDYVKLFCKKDKLEVVAESINYNWYSKSNDQLQLDDGRLYIDQNGDLHINYAKTTDASDPFGIKCGLSGRSSANIVFGDAYNLYVTPVTQIPGQAPVLKWFSANIVAEVSHSARLECVFSGYDPMQPLPTITWTLDDGTVISTNQKYNVSSNGRSLIIYKLLEQDERNYYCKAKNNFGESNPHQVFLNVTSKPIFYENKAPRDVTVSQNKDVTIPCEARSASGEATPSPAVWYVNGRQTGQHTNRNKIDVKTNSLTIKSVKKPDDIMCVLCIVSNSNGEKMGEACVNVILPIDLTQQINVNQEIDMGDSIDLTVLAKTDISQQLIYKWTHFRNKSDLVGEEPKFTFHDSVTKVAYINTTGMTEAEYESLRGDYVVNISHLYDYRIERIHVTLKDKPAPEEPVATEAGFDMWIIGLIIGILFLIIVIIIIIIVICRKQQEGDYNVPPTE